MDKKANFLVRFLCMSNLKGSGDCELLEVL
jgi:hypothetical protein